MHILVLLSSDIRQEQRVNKELATLRHAGHADARRGGDWGGNT
jgi:hypothetical protein